MTATRYGDVAMEGKNFSAPALAAARISCTPSTKQQQQQHRQHRRKPRAHCATTTNALVAHFARCCSWRHAVVVSVSVMGDEGVCASCTVATAAVHAPPAAISLRSVCLASTAAAAGLGALVSGACYYYRNYVAPRRERCGEGVPWAIAREHEWERIARDLADATLNGIEFNDAQRYECHNDATANVVDAATWFTALLNNSEGSSLGERAATLSALIQEKESEWSVAPCDAARAQLPPTGSMQSPPPPPPPQFAVEVLCAVQVRAGRPVKLVWTAHFGDTTSPDTAVAARYVDLYVTANDAPSYGPGHGRLVARLYYTCAPAASESSSSSSSQSACAATEMTTTTLTTSNNDAAEATTKPNTVEAASS